MSRPKARGRSAAREIRGKKERKRERKEKREREREKQKNLPETKKANEEGKKIFVWRAGNLKLKMDEFLKDDDDLLLDSCGMCSALYVGVYEMPARAERKCMSVWIVALAQK